MYSKEFCRTVANGRTRQDPEAARVIHWLLDALEETEAAALRLKALALGVTATPTRNDDGIFDTMITGPSMRDLFGAKPAHSDQLCKGPNCNAVRGGVHSPECIQRHEITTATGDELDRIGHRLDACRNVNETDAAYRERLIVRAYNPAL